MDFGSVVLNFSVKAISPNEYPRCWAVPHLGFLKRKNGLNLVVKRL